MYMLYMTVRARCVLGSSYCIVRLPTSITQKSIPADVLARVPALATSGGYGSKECTFFAGTDIGLGTFHFPRVPAEYTREIINIYIVHFDIILIHLFNDI